MRAPTRRSLLVWLPAIALVAGCGTAAPSQAPPAPALYRDSIATVDTDEIEIRAGPGADYRLVGRLSQGDRLFVQHTAGGWALVQAAGSEHLSGWLSLAGPDGGPSVAAASLDCPPPPYDLERIASLDPEERLACYGDRTISMTAGVIRSDHVEALTYNDPGWLLDPAYPCRSGPDSDGPWLEIAYAPDSGLECPERLLGRDGRFRISGHFDDPAAATCSSYAEDMDGVTTNVPAYEAAFRCRVQFVVTAFVDLDLPTSTPDPPSAHPFVGQLVVTVSDRLRVRSQPWVGDDSVKYGPLLPIYSELRVLDGPVAGSGYIWYQVEPLDFTLDDGPGYGWVAVAGKDGEPWIGPKPATGLVPPTPTGTAFAEDWQMGDDQARIAITQTARWRTPRTPGVMIRVYGVTECIGYPASPAPGASGPCLDEDTPLPASALRLLATAPASDGVASWTWTQWEGCESAPFMAKPGGLWYESIVLAAYTASGHSDFAIAEPGQWWVWGPGDMPC